MGGITTGSGGSAGYLPGVYNVFPEHYGYQLGGPLQSVAHGGLHHIASTGHTHVEMPPRINANVYFHLILYLLTISYLLK